ncbi:MAG: 2,3-bisphosphoglycerate-independent phosphoglycerate mutase [Deltaproteobacteria bacterium]|nr:2,3-bisphosphoglycerate-independent phosphoglycerate mutase [Deltaproteobacteria bacterium]
MDGWGINPDKKGNATRLADLPNLTRLYQEYPGTALDTSGLAVGLPPGQMGNSEVGQLTMGAGRVIYQELTRIGKAIEDGEFHENAMLDELFSYLKDKDKALHVMGLLSDGGVHSHICHLYAILDAAKKKGLSKVYIHAFLDGRDTPPASGAGYMEELVSYMNKNGVGRVASVSGRYYAMDRDNRWERVEKAYNAIAKGEGRKAADPVAAIKESYGKGETDEFFTPTVMEGGGGPVNVSDNDAVFFFNFRADRAREITKPFVLDDFDGFKRGERPRIVQFICMTEYEQKLNLPVLFKPQDIKNILGEVLSKAGIKQFRVSETEKYAHVTFFFNGGKEAPFPGEDRVLIPSVKDVPTYDLSPEMRALEIAGTAVEKIEKGGYGFMLMNFANGDMVGHTGVLDAAIKACGTVDKAIGIVVGAALKMGWACIITSDHGNAEQMVDPETNEPFTAHTTNRVPFILVDGGKKDVKLKSGGLQDVAPTVLKLLEIESPEEMKGEPLF